MFSRLRVHHSFENAMCSLSHAEKRVDLFEGVFEEKC